MPIRHRIGVFGGTFDPVHIGHLIIAEILQHDLKLEKVLFLPAGRPPHKPEQELAADHHRTTMIKMAIKDCPAFEICTVDLDRAGSSFTAGTLEILTGQYGEFTELFFLMGQDSLRDFPSWRDPERIVQSARLGVAMRPHVDVSIESINAAVPETTGRIHQVDIPLIDVSSRDIRRRIRNSEPFRFQVPHGVADYITENGLYQSAQSAKPA